MQRFLTAVCALAFVVGLSGAVDAKTCRDAKGKFVKCPVASPMPGAKKPCRDSKGKFIKCKTM